MLKKTPLQDLISLHAQAALSTLSAKNAQDIISIPLNNKSDISDLMIIASGNSTTHVSALAHHVEKALEESGAYIMGVEGKEDSRWVIIDSPEVIVHIFHPEDRERYNLEGLWRCDFSETAEDIHHIV